MELKRRTPGETVAYHQGAVAGLNTALRALKMKPDDPDFVLNMVIAVQQALLDDAQTLEPTPQSADDDDERVRLNQAMTAIMRLGHSNHCAHRLAFGDGQCECGKRADEANPPEALFCEPRDDLPRNYEGSWKCGHCGEERFTERHEEAGLCPGRMAERLGLEW